MYGLGASIYNEKAVRRIFEVKQRPLNMALPILVSGIEQLKTVAVNITGTVECIVKHFWPGALTLVLLKSAKVSGIVTANGTTVAVRMPAHTVPLAIIKGLDIPIIGTSANLSSKPSPITAAEVGSQLGGKVDMIIDGGTPPGGRESTILDLTQDQPVILRQGTITLESINAACNMI